MKRAEQRERKAARRSEATPRTSGHLTHGQITRAMEADLIARAQVGENNAAEVLLRAHEPLLVTWCYPFRERGLTWDDLMQAARIGFWDALKRFDPKRSKRITTYAGYRVLHELVSAVAEACAIRQTSTVYDKLSKVRTGREADTEETQGLRRLLNAKSLDTCIPGTPLPWVEAMASDDQGPEEHLAAADTVAARARLISAAMASPCMTDVEREIVRRRHFAEEPETLLQIGQSMSLSRERIRQIEKAALGKVAMTVRRLARKERIDARSELW